jgi:cytochrome P450
MTKYGSQAFPVYDVDLFSDAVLRDPYPHYLSLRELGPAVYLPQNGVWVLPRYESVRKALDAWQTVSSTDGIALNAVTNEATSMSPLACDPPEHRTPRKVLAQRLSPMAVQEQADAVEGCAEELCAAVCRRGSFDAVCDFAQPFALSTLVRHVGLQTDDLAVLGDWADAVFDVMGPENARTRAARTYLAGFGIHLLAATTPDRLEPNGAGAAIYTAGQCGDLTTEGATQLLAIYLLAAIPTMIAATSTALWLFARNPEQWEALRAQPSLAANAVNEILRLESPTQSFSRVIRSPYQAGSATVPAGARVILLFGSANRDDRLWHNPDAFDIGRDRVADHVAFGHGLHGCAGQVFAKMAIGSAVKAFVDHAQEWRPGEARWKVNNLLRGLESFPVAVNGHTPRRLGGLMVRKSPDVQVMDWRLAGTISLARLRVSVPLSPEAKFTGIVNIADGMMAGTMDIPSAATRIKILGISAGATTQIAPVGSFEGLVAASADGKIKMSATTYAHLEVRAVHLGRISIKLRCRTVRPIEMCLYSEGVMSLTFRPAFVGDMTIPPLKGNGPIGWLLSKLISGAGNNFNIGLDLLGSGAGSLVASDYAAKSS